MTITRRHVLATGLGAIAVGCTTGTPLSSVHLAPAAPLPAYPAPYLGLNVITYGAIDPTILQHLAAIGPLTLRCPFRSVSQLLNISDSMRAFPTLRLAGLIERIDDTLVARLAETVPQRMLLANLDAITLGNELDLAGVSARDAHDWTMRSYATLRGAGWTGDLYSPSLYCVQPDHLHDYAFPLWQGLPDDIVFDLHRYQGETASVDDGQDGYTSRTDENQTIRNMIGVDRRVVVSEVGWPTRTLGDMAYALDAARRDRVWARRLGAIGWCYYQLLDGKGTGNIDHYGLRAIDGTWKGLESVIVP